MIGIYKITNPVGHIYIGQTINLPRRIIMYRNLCCKTQHRLYNSIKKYGWENHQITLIHPCDKENLNFLEIAYIELYDTLNTPHGMNLQSGGNTGIIKSDETRKKISLSNKGRVVSEETKKLISKNVKEKLLTDPSIREKISRASKGRFISDDTRKKRSLSLIGKNKGRIHTEASRKNMGLGKKGKPAWNKGKKITCKDTLEKMRSLRTGKKHTELAKLKIGVAHKGKKRTEEQIKKLADFNRGKKRSDESREKMRKAHIGKKLNPELIEKLRKINTGRAVSEETKRKISIANKGRVVSEETRNLIKLNTKIALSNPEIRQKMRAAKSIKK